jgi:membrane protease YdiL (CAAX protease family)
MPRERLPPVASTGEDQETGKEDDLLPGPENDRPTRDVIIILAVFFEAGLAPFSVLLGWLLGHRPLEGFVWRLEDALWGAGAAVPLFVMFLAILNWPIGPLARVKKFCEEDVVPLFQESSWSELALISLSAGVGEEMLFRGVLQAALSHWLGTAGGLVVASVLFGFMHAISMTYIVIAGFLGLYLGGIWIANGNLLTVMVTHALYDFVALGYLIRIQHGGSE